MENALTGLIVIGIMVLALLGLTQSSLAAQASLMEATRLMQNRLADQARTNLTALSASTALSGNEMYVTLKNTGNSKLADFTHWDVILTYTDITPTVRGEWHANWLKHISEKIEPGILNPGEEMTVTVPVSFTIGDGTTNVVTVGTPNGVTASTIFTH